MYYTTTTTNNNNHNNNDMYHNAYIYIYIYIITTEDAGSRLVAEAPAAAAVEAGRGGA